MLSRSLVNDSGYKVKWLQSCLRHYEELTEVIFPAKLFFFPSYA